MNDVVKLFLTIFLLKQATNLLNAINSILDKLIKLLK